MESTERNEDLDRLLDMSEQERDETIRREIAESLPATIPALVKAFVDEEAYKVVLDDYAVLDVVREALAAIRSEEAYKDLERRAAEREAEKEDDEEDEE